MADLTRQKTLSVLRRYELSVSELVEVLDQPQSTVSRHLKILRDAKLIKGRREGNTVMYSIPSVSNGHGQDDLSIRLIEWIDDQPLHSSLGLRIKGVLHRRRDMSRSFFDRTGDKWDKLREESFGGEFQWEAFLGLLPNDWTVVDIGTGTGYLLPTLVRYFQKVIGVDPVDRMLEVAQRRLDFHRLDQVELRKGDLVHLPIKNDSVDLALAFLVLHHVPEPREAIQELFRIVRSGGCILIVEQQAHQNESFHERMQDRWWGFDSTEFSSMLQSVGFQKIRLQSLLNVKIAADAPELFMVTGFKE